MSEPNLSRPVRKVAVADHIWEAFEQMAHQMGTERDGLINQAMFMFARLNGFLEAARAAGAEASPRAAAGMDEPAGAAGYSAAPARRPTGPALAPRPSLEVAPAGGSLDNDPDRLLVAERVLETAAELEKMIKGGKPAEPAVEKPAPASHAEPSGAPMLVVVCEQGELEMIKDRFVIGRGKTCDLVINSGKVSREHAAIVREGEDFYIEDLGSSNGTWFNKQRIKRRKIIDGDEFFICSEKVKCVMR